MNDLPAGWAETPLGNVADVVRGVTYSKKDAASTAQNGFLPILRATNINRALDLDSEMVFVPERYVKPSQRMRPGDIVVAASSGSANVVGKSAQLQTPWTGGFGAFCSVIRPCSGVEHRYLAHFVAGPRVRNAWRALAQGTNINNLKTSDLANTVVPLPPLREQERIVAAIEEQFSRVDAGAAALKRVRRNLLRMKAAVLKAAVTGELLIDSDRREMMGEELPGGWSWQPLGRLISRIRNGIFVSRPVAEPSGLPILRISAVRPLSLNIADIRYVSSPEKLKRVDDFVLASGDLLFTRYSGNPEYVGACAIVPPGAPRLLYPDKLIRVQVDRSLMDPQFMMVAAATGRTRREIRARIKTTAGQTGISGSDLKGVSFPVPPLEIQRIIVEHVDRFLTRIAALEAYLAFGEQRVSLLRSAILAEAFSGSLVHHDVNDGSGSALLDCISAERASSSNGDGPDHTRQSHKRVTA